VGVASAQTPLRPRESRGSSSDKTEWDVTDRFPLIGAWSARAMLVLVVAYVVVFVGGFDSLGNLSKPLPDPYLAIAEVLTLVMAPVMVVLMLAIHECAPARVKPFTQVALGWMLAAAAFTTIVHFVELT